MIVDVDASLRALLRATALRDPVVDVVFDAPTQDWASRTRGDVVNAFLYEIRENLTRRPNDWEEVRNEVGVITGRRPPLRRYDLSYVVTAWASTAEREHTLLSRMLVALVSDQAIPPEHVAGALAEEGVPVYVAVGLPGNPPMAPMMWSMLGVPPRPSLDLVVTAPLPRPTATAVAGPVLTRRLTVGVPEHTAELVPSERRDELLRERRAPPANPAEPARRIVRRG
jgi:hypothetical protein